MVLVVQGCASTPVDAICAPGCLTPNTTLSLLGVTRQAGPRACVISKLGTTGGVLAALGFATIATRPQSHVSRPPQLVPAGGGLGVLFLVAEVTGGLGWIG